MSADGPSRNIPKPPQAATLAIEVLRHGGAWDDGVVSDAAIELAAHAAFSQAAPIAPVTYEIAILLTDDAEMSELNRNWRGKNAPTNVLSFPAGDAAGTDGADGALGDIVIAYETTQTEAKEAGITLSDHTGHLVVHGVLHLLGFDHLNDAEAEKMEDLERKALASLGIADPYEHGDEAGHAEVT